jgi:hypothetical protein
MALEQRRALAEMFELSENDKESRGQRLSVWIEALTTADQAWDFMGSKPANTVVACMNADAIRAIPAADGFASLNVEWECAVIGEIDGTTRKNCRPGAEGHCGISGLNQGGKGKQDKLKRKSIRSQLADVASISPVPVPHDFLEEHLQVAAYYLSTKPGEKTGSPESDWVEATRQLRRSRARASRNFQAD